MAYTEKMIEKTKERLSDLRHEKDLSYDQLSACILESENTKISHGTLQKYEICDDQNKNNSLTTGMSITRFVALADFYDVPVDYLLGRIDSKKEENIPVSKELGISDEAIDNIKNIIAGDKSTSESLSVQYSEVLNEILSCPALAIIVERVAKAKTYANLYNNYCLDGNHDDVARRHMYDATFSDIGKPFLNYKRAGEFYAQKAKNEFHLLMDYLVVSELENANADEFADDQAEYEEYIRFKKEQLNIKSNN